MVGDFSITWGQNQEPSSRIHIFWETGQHPSYCPRGATLSRRCSLPFALEWFCPTPTCPLLIPQRPTGCQCHEGIGPSNSRPSWRQLFCHMLSQVDPLRRGRPSVPWEGSGHSHCLRRRRSPMDHGSSGPREGPGSTAPLGRPSWLQPAPCLIPVVAGKLSSPSEPPQGPSPLNPEHRVPRPTSSSLHCHSGQRKPAGLTWTRLGQDLECSFT